MSVANEPMILTLLLPVLGALLVGTTGRQMGRFGSALVASGAVFLSFLVVVCTVVQKLTGYDVPQSVTLWTWMDGFGAGGQAIPFGIYLDALSLTLMSVITGVGFLIHWFSSEYMEHDEDATRFFTLLNVFIAAMTFLVLADNYATLIIGWGGVGFASFALIGFWRHKPSAGAAAKKAFVMNVIGDVGLMLAVFVLYKFAGTVTYSTLFTEVLPALSTQDATPWLMVVMLGLLLGAYAKSAQLPMHTWLPDAMEGPTPVSALIHAATMVTAGVYLLIRSAPLLGVLPGDVSLTIGYLGAITALFAACCAMVQTDLKRVLAYSTMSQLGYMFLAIGVGAYSAAIFHLVTHAFFKALLFLTAGIVIHAAHGEQDMRKLGGLARQMPTTAVLFAGGALCLAGFPLTSGFFSKEAILHAAHDHQQGTLLFLIGALVAVMTAFYTGRAFCLTFLGPRRIDHPHLPGAPTTGACTVLWLLSMGAGALYPDLQAFLSPDVSGPPITPGATSGAAIVLSCLVVVTLGVAYAMFGKGQPDRMGAEGGAISFVRGGFGFDGFYGLLASWTQRLSRVGSKEADRIFQEGLPGLVGRSFHGVSFALKELQTGGTRFYMVVFSGFVGVLLLLTTLLLSGGGLQ
jgi:NADH-quinone oxidoreductase subunit L